MRRPLEPDPDMKYQILTPAEEEVTITNIHIKNASLAFEKRVIFTNLNVDLAAKQWIGLLGPSGIGKSSLLRMMAGLYPAQEGAQAEIYVDNQRPVSQHIAYMAQTDLLLPWLSALENTILKLKLRHHTKQERISETEKAITLFKKVGLADAIHLYPQQLSGGMRQRVALIRTLMEDKPIVLMDEPFSALDAITRYHLQGLAADLLKDKTVIFVTHDPIEALRLAHTIYIMQGQPATLKLVAHLPSPIPRDLSDSDIIRLQSLLFHELTQAAGQPT